jgi:hypothetical protein
MRRLLIIILSQVLLSATNVIAAEADNVFLTLEMQMVDVAAQLSATRYNDAAQDSLDAKLVAMLGSALKKSDSFEYPFDSLKTNISIVTSADGRLRIFTWFSVSDAGDYHYSGYMQYNDKQARAVRLFALNDCSDNMEKIDNLTLTPQNWYGMVYYDIVENKSHDGMIYTLLGWDGCGLYTTRKIVEPMFFTDKGQPRFGKMMVKVGRKKSKRLVFEYNKRATMMIQYDSQLGYIVMDHLSVMGSQDTDNPMFFVPDMSYDALKFEDDMWIYVPKIDYKRPKPKKR